MEFCIYANDGAVTQFLTPELKAFSEPLGIEVRLIDRSQLVGECYLEKNQENILGFWLPGNRSGQNYLDGFGEKGVEQIRQYVTNGGCYFGICAGAYLAVRNVRYCGPEKTPEGFKRIGKKKRVSPFGFFDGCAHGELPLYGANKYREGWETATTVSVTYADVNYVRRQNDFIYWGGPAYRPAPDEQIEEMAHYVADSLSGRSYIAMAAKQVGRGCAVISGIHPEMTADSMRLTPRPYPEYPVDERYHKLVAAMERTDRKENDLFALFVSPVFAMERGQTFMASRPCQAQANGVKQGLALA